MGGGIADDRKFNPGVIRGDAGPVIQKRQRQSPSGRKAVSENNDNKLKKLLPKIIDGETVFSREIEILVKIRKLRECSYKWKHTLCGPLGLASLTQHNLFKALLCCMSQYFHLSIPQLMDIGLFLLTGYQE